MIGQTVSHYRITGKLGEGGMGAVFRAEDTKLGRAVALKFLPTNVAGDPAAARQLLKEAQVASRLNHPNIATIYEVGEAQGAPFIAMEVVEGESLRDILARGPLPQARLLDIARQVADGLQVAHDAGVLHRDLKPANIMVGPQGRVKILDFGLAVIAGRERAPGEGQSAFITRSRAQWSTGGTIPYMPPEQLRGEATDVRGDIFSFGVLLYECLTGRLPFPGDTAIDIMHAILHAPPAPLGAAGVSPSWERSIARCLAKAPEERFATVAEMREAFRGDAAEPVDERSIAVLYFENLSGDEKDVYFRDGMTEDIITELSQIRGLRVFPRSAVLQFRDRPTTAAGVLQTLNARYVLEGSIRRASDRLRITAQLVETNSGHSAWAKRYDRKLEDVFAIQDEIAQSIAGALKLVLTDSEKRAIEKKATADVQAYDFYLRGRQFFHQFRRRAFDYARQMFARAIVIDPNYARAYAGVADCCSMLHTYWEATDENLKEADVASRKALALDPNLAEAHVSRGLAVSLGKDFAEAETEFETALRLDPECFEAYYFYARACWAQGKLEQTARLFERASRLRPEDYQVPSLLSSIYPGLGRPGDAQAADRSAVEAARKRLELAPDDVRALYLGGVSLARLGHVAEGLAWAHRALEIEAGDPVLHYNVACIHAGFGKAEDALSHLSRAIDLGFAQRAWIENDSDFARLRPMSEFHALLARL
jgi:non-specific serine/threonine protein kinase